MALGPIEVVMISFPGNEFNGEILPEIARLTQLQTISIIDALFVMKDNNDDITFVEFDDLLANEDVARLVDLIDKREDLISDEDVREFASGLAPNCSAALLIFEHTWSKPLRDAIVDSGGELVLNFRIPGATVKELLPELAG